jgi:hypothetical protein
MILLFFISFEKEGKASTRYEEGFDRDWKSMSTA